MLPFHRVILYTNAMEHSPLSHQIPVSEIRDVEQQLDVLQLPEAKLLIGEHIKASPESQGGRRSSQSARRISTNCLLAQRYGLPILWRR